MGASAPDKLRLLMWKNFLQQWRHKLQTVAEILLPVLTASLIVILRVEIEPIEYDRFTYPPIPAYSLQYSQRVLQGMELSNMSIAYSPESPILDSILRRAVVRLAVRNLEILLPGNDTLPELSPEVIEAIIEQQNLIGVRGYNDSGQIQDVFLPTDATRQLVAVIQFDDSLRGATVLPDNLSYELRFPLRPRLNLFYASGSWTWNTDRTFPVYPAPGPRAPYSWEGGRNPGYVNEMFIALQHAISMELVREKAPEAAALAVNIQRFPHPAYTSDMLIGALQYLFPMLVMMSFTYTAVSTVRFVGREKELQLKESMKIMGLPTWLHWTAWFLKQFLFLLITVSIMVFVLKMEWYETEAGLTGYSIFTATPWTVIFVFMSLYVACTIFFAFMISGFFDKASTAALFMSVFWFLSYLPALFLTTDSDTSFAAKFGSCLSVNSAMALGFQIILANEGAHKGMSWGDFFTPQSAEDNFFFGYVMLMLLFDCVLYMLLALYIEKVFPGSFGVGLAWYFPVLPSYWFPNMKKNKDLIKNEEIHQVTREDDPIGHEKGVEIQNLTKIFGKQIAVDHLNLNIYVDQITVLLGHNGAGKTTTISMLTGMLSPTYGTASLAGYNIGTHMSKARSSLGICPQHNVLFSDLTVREHLQFFSRLKGLKGEQLKHDVEKVIVKLELEEKATTQAGALSGGQKRRLSVGVALCGSPRVVLLDEPTSGMDPASRRALWDLLQREKKERAMILTTHFMDEADILGDRIAIMSGGRLRCVGSPFFLKQHFGAGYKLVVVKEERCLVAPCTELLRRHIPEVKLHSDRGLELYYTLPADQSHKFQPMLQDLEEQQATLGVNSFGLSPSNLEDVFMKVGADTESPEEEKEFTSQSSGSPGTPVKFDEDNSASTEYLHDKDVRVTGLRLLGNHVLAMWMKRSLVTLRDWKMSLLQFFIPIIVTAITVLLVHYISTSSSSAPSRSLDIVEGYINTEALISQNGSAEAGAPADLARAAYAALFAPPGPTNMSSLDIGDRSMEDYYLERGAVTEEMARMRFRNTIGATFAPDTVTAWFSNFGYHDVAVSLAAAHNALLQAYAPGASVHVINHPLAVTSDDQTNMQLLNSVMAMQLSNSIGTSMAIVASFFVVFYVKERMCRAKLLQKSSGIQPVVLWGASAVFDWLWFSVISIGVIITCAALQVEGFSSAAQLGRGFVVFMIFGASMLPLHYLAAFLFTGAASGFVISYFLNTLLGNIGAMIVDALRTPGLTTQAVADWMEAVLQFFPTYSMINAFRLLVTIGLTESSCMEVCSVLGDILGVTDCDMQTVCDSGIDACCMPDDPYFHWDPPGMLQPLILMLASGAVCWLALLTIEYRLFDKVINCRKRTPQTVDESTEDADVAEEERLVARVGAAELANYNLLCRGLTKFYGKSLAVNQVSFSVRGSEIFGLLGVNGAGKTSTFKMLTGDVAVSGGDAFVRGHSVRTHIKRVHENIGYCPQFDALFEELTGRETMRLYSLLRGIRAQDSAALTHDLASRLHFQSHLDKLVGHYSGGNRRKLSTALALLGRAPVVYLDEPTTGVDPAAKRQVWGAVRHSSAAGSSVLLTSHSMEECEALCSRLAIMVNGRFKCLGTPQHLKNKFSQGYILTVKLKAADDRVEGTRRVDAVQAYITHNFPGARLMEVYEGLVTCYLPHGSGPWSRMFGIMEGARQLLEDYTISQTTLEQVFLQFTKFQIESL